MKNPSEERASMITEGRSTTDDEALAEFLSRISHDLNQPLRHLSSFSEFLQRDLSEGNQNRVHEDLDYIQDATHKLKQRLEALERLAEVKTRSLSPTRFDPSTVIREVLDELVLDEPETSIESDIPGIPEIKGDRFLFSILIEELLKNACQFSDSEPVNIQVTFETKGDGVTIGIRDRGIGIPNPDHNELFEPFVKADESSMQQGLGIGLTLCRAVLRKHQGRIWIEQVEGPGSLVRFFLPQSAAEVEG